MQYDFAEAATEIDGHSPCLSGPDYPASVILIRIHQASRRKLSPVFWRPRDGAVVGDLLVLGARFPLSCDQDSGLFAYEQMIATCVFLIGCFY